MRTYVLYFIIKDGGQQYINSLTVEASNIREARVKCVKTVDELCGKHAFTISTKKPEGYDPAKEFPIKK